MTIIHYTPVMRPQFADLLADYFPEVGSGIPEEIIRGRLLHFIENLHKQNLISIAAALEADVLIGFSIFQIDTPESDWCKRPGWGFVREFYIQPVFRRSGYGRQLAIYTEATLKDMGAENLYLTSAEETAAFWLACGWRRTDSVCSNDLLIFEK